MFASSNPLVVDLDGTLILTDMLHESALKVLRESPLSVLRIPRWLSQGKAVLKSQLAERTQFDASALPYNLAFLDWLKAQKQAGRRLVLCTATDRTIATQIADHLGVFDDVMASEGDINLAGRHKADALEARFGQGGFDYAGNSNADLAVWQRARRAIVVNASNGLTRKAEDCCEVEQVFPPAGHGLSAWRRVLRVHQWLKNILLFVPLFAAHEVLDLNRWLTLTLAFFAFCLCASAVYIGNDLLDLESDRQHLRKKNRPFASGLVPAWMGVLLLPMLLAASLALAWCAGLDFLRWVVCYFLLTCAYSWGLKRVMLVDCLTLALLYTLRIVAGAAAADLPLSFWLLAFSVFLFLSLAFVKRYAELEMQINQGKEKAHGRGYYATDAPLIQTMGITAGYASVLVLALYLNSNAVLKLYQIPEFVWGAVPVTLFWISWMWLQAHRGNMHDDPLVFAVKDKASLACGAAFAVVLLLGSTGWLW